MKVLFAREFLDLGEKITQLFINYVKNLQDCASMQGAVIAADGWNHKEELEAKAKVVTVGNEWQSDLDLSSSSNGQENTKPYFYQNQTTLHLFPSPQLEDSHNSRTFTPTCFFKFLPLTLY